MAKRVKYLRYSLRCLMAFITITCISCAIACYLLKRHGVEQYDMYFMPVPVNQKVTTESAEESFRDVMIRHGLHRDAHRNVLTEYLRLDPSSERGGHFDILTDSPQYQGIMAECGKPVIVAGSRLPLSGNASERTWISFYSVRRYWMWEAEGAPSKELVGFAIQIRIELLNALERLNEAGKASGSAKGDKDRSDYNAAAADNGPAFNSGGIR